jgi:hypothetical protein
MNDRNISFPFCEDPDMLPLVVTMGSVTKKNEIDMTWWAETVSSLQGWEEFWKPRLVLECDGSTVLASSSLESMSGTNNLTARIDPSAAYCSITTERFDLVWRATYDVRNPRTTRMVEKTRNTIPKKIGNLTQEIMVYLIDLSTWLVLSGREPCCSV